VRLRQFEKRPELGAPVFLFDFEFRLRVRIDPKVLEWLRSKGEGHLTRINDILTNLKQAECLAGSGAADGEREVVSLVGGVCRIPRPQLRGTWGTRRLIGTQNHLLAISL